MSFDVIVWLGCSVSLPQALPTPQAWVHYRLPALKIEGLPPATAAKLGDSEMWQLAKDEHLINASYASKDPLTVDDLKSISPGIKVFAIPSGASAPVSAARSADKGRQAALQGQARAAKVGVSLVLEGVTDERINDLLQMAGHLASTCNGAVLESPTGFHLLDATGQKVD